MFDDYSERLFAHFVAGLWRAPFGDDAQAVLSHQGHALGQVVAAGPSDVARAVAVRRGADLQACRRLADEVERGAEHLVLAHESQAQHAQVAKQIARMAGCIAEPATTPGGGVLLSMRDTCCADLGRALGAGILGGVIWCPPAEGAIFATTMACLVQQADLPPGAFALLHTRVPATEAALRATSLYIQER
jgi:hypothetical protein